jgi:hypothetical protein
VALTFPLERQETFVKRRTSGLIAVLAALALVPAAARAASPVDSLFTWDDLHNLKIYHAYAASDGHSYVEVINTQAMEKGPNSQTYFDFSHPQQIKIGRGKSGEMVDWHYALQSRHLIIPLQGDVVFDLGDGKLLHVHPGEAIMAEDWAGKGHRSGCLSADKPTCVGIDILYEPNPHSLPLRAPPAKN